MAHLEKDLSILKDSGRKQQFIKGCRSCTEKDNQKCADNANDFSTSSNFLQEMASLLAVVRRRDLLCDELLVALAD